MFRSVLLAAVGLLVVTSARAGPVFEIIGLGSLGYNASLSWGITTTGSGRIDGQLVLRDGYVLPTSGGTSTIALSDLVSLTYSHTDPDLLDSNVVTPTFNFNASAGQFLAVSGTIQESSGTYSISPASFDLQTSVGLSIGGNIGGGLTGLFQGDARLLNTVLEIADTTLPNPTGTIRLVQNSQQQGRWRLTGFTVTTVPEPASMLVLAAPVAWLAVSRRRKEA